jgi:Flp pilus assembly protein TadB
MLSGLMSGLCVWFGVTLVTLPFAAITFFAIPLLMWMTLRYVCDETSKLMVTQLEQVARGCNRSIPRFRFVAPAPLCG